MQCDVQPAAPREFRRAEGAVEAPVTGTCRRGRSDTSIGSGWRPLVLLGHFRTLLDRTGHFSSFGCCQERRAKKRKDETRAERRRCTARAERTRSRHATAERHRDSEQLGVA